MDQENRNEETAELRQELGQLSHLSTELDEPLGDPDGQPLQAANDDQGPETPTIPTAQLLAPAVQMACAALAPAWEIQPEEQQALCEAYGSLIDKYAPDGLTAYSVELTAVTVTAAVFLPRMKKPRKLEEKGKAEAKTEPEGQGEVIPGSADAS